MKFWSAIVFKTQGSWCRLSPGYPFLPTAPCLCCLQSATARTIDTANWLGILSIVVNAFGPPLNGLSFPSHCLPFPAFELLFILFTASVPKFSPNGDELPSMRCDVACKLAQVWIGGASRPKGYTDNLTGFQRATSINASALHWSTKQSMHLDVFGYLMCNY